MANQICNEQIRLGNKFKLDSKDLEKSKIPVISPAKTAEERLARIVGKQQEVLARGQVPSEVDSAVIRSVRRDLNKIMTGCEKLDENKGVYDAQLEQRVAQFQKLHLASDPRCRGEREVDGIVGKKTFGRIQEILKTADNSVSVKSEESSKDGARADRHMESKLKGVTDDIDPNRSEREKDRELRRQSGGETDDINPYRSEWQKNRELRRQSGK